MKNSRTCCTCQDPFEDAGAGKRSAPAGFCSRECDGKQPRMSDTREERIAAITRGLWRAPKPPHGRYLVKVSYEDSSDVCDWFETHDDFEEAVDVYRAYWVWDLDGSAKWDVEAVNVARLVSGGDEGNTP